MSAPTLTIDLQIPPTALFAGRGGQIVDEELGAAVAAGLVMIRGAVVPRTPVGVSGSLRGAWQIDIRGQTPMITGRVFNPLIYGPPVEAGARPHWPPRGPIELWVRRKLQVAEKEVRGVAFLVARKISREGTKAVRMAEQAITETRGKVEARWQLALQRIAQRLGGSS